MVSIARVPPLGAPGVYPYPFNPIRAIGGVRMDVCAFVGVAPRGPANIPIDGSPDLTPRRTLAVAVESFDEYRQLYGGFEGPGLMPYSVASFFEQGGRRAYIARIVHDYRFDSNANSAINNSGVAFGIVPGVTSTAGEVLQLQARNVGGWGNFLHAGLSFTKRQLLYDPIFASLTGLELSYGIDLAPGALLRLNYDSGFHEFRFVADTIQLRPSQKTGSVLTVIFDHAATSVPITIDIVEVVMNIDDSVGRFERYERLGLSPSHPRWIAAILAKESTLVYPDNAWRNSAFRPDDETLADPPASKLFSGGNDRYPDITPDDFFDRKWTLGDEEPGNGIHALSQLTDLSLLVVPDLYSPFPLTEPRKLYPPISLVGPTFTRCFDLPTQREETEPPLADLVNLRLNPALPEDLERITALQARVVDFAEQLRSFVVLLDVPPGLTQRRIINWRTRFQSSYAAGYHPWLFVVRQDDKRNTRIPLPPSAPAAGIIAQVENSFGVPHGPANVITAQVLDVREAISPKQHDELHPLGINVFLLERDGVRLTAARTLSSDPDYRQLSVRRLLVLLRRTLEQQMQWAVFEPNNSALRSELRQLLRAYLRQLFTAGAFRGATEDESFFVHCDEENNPPRIADLGQVLVEIGVAPSEPLEFIIMRLSRDGDGTLTVTEARG
ncbi:phage tail sheath C-terminal domain-containing protein [Methyloglobulus sp.]|uniref:phage tail sheath family protein n=1 Tax=Methyloglobulus sp. TaxID=2518622 RepID=UPI0032B7BF67